MTDGQVFIAEPVIDRVVTIKPDDVVLFRSTTPFSLEDGERLREHIEKHIADTGIRFLLLGPNWDIAAVLRHE